MVMHGFDTTVPVTLDMMILQGHAVMRGFMRALVVVGPTCRSRWRTVSAESPVKSMTYSLSLK